MKKQIKEIGAVLLTALILTSCGIFNKISAPKYNSNAYQTAVTADSIMNVLYTGLATGSTLDYNSSAPTYENVESIISGKIASDSLRKYPTQILQIDRTYLEVVESSRADHQRDGNISKNHINVNGALLNQIGNILVNTEKNYK